MADKTTPMLGEKLGALAGPDTPQALAFEQRVREWLGSRPCPCVKGNTCQWPNCARTGDGIGHYP